MRYILLSAPLLLSLMVCLPAQAADGQSNTADISAQKGGSQIRQMQLIAIPERNMGTAKSIDGLSFAREPEAPTAASGGGLICPPELRSLIAVQEKETKDWVVGGPEQSAPLKGARLFAGPLSEQTMERYNELTAIPSMNRDRGEFEQVWHFDENLLKSGVMLVCDYAGSNHFLMRSVPPGTKECKEVDAIDKTDTSPTMVSCK